MIVRGQKQMEALGRFIMTLRRFDVVNGKLSTDYSKANPSVVDVYMPESWIEWDSVNNKPVTRTRRSNR